jgi:hypothetical protein
MKNLTKYCLFVIILLISTIIYFSLIKHDNNITAFECILIGFISSALVVLFTEFLNNSEMKNKFKNLAGDWKEYNISGRKISVDSQADVKIKYIKNNILKVNVTHDDENKRTWTGYIIMNKDNFNIGKIIWHYQLDKNNEHEFGIKNILLPKNDFDLKNDYIYCISENYQNNKYGNVVWKRES